MAVQYRCAGDTPDTDTRGSLCNLNAVQPASVGFEPIPRPVDGHRATGPGNCTLNDAARTRAMFPVIMPGNAARDARRSHACSVPRNNSGEPCMRCAAKSCQQYSPQQFREIRHTSADPQTDAGRHACYRRCSAGPPPPPAAPAAAATEQGHPARIRPLTVPLDVPIIRRTSKCQRELGSCTCPAEADSWVSDPDRSRPRRRHSTDRTGNE